MLSTDLCVVGFEVVSIGFVNFCVFVPTVLRVFIFRNVELLHKYPVSDIPGNPHSFGSAIISLFRTLPEPSNFNIVWTGLSFSEPLMIRGHLPFSRFNSLSVYGAGSTQPPNSIDLTDVAKSNSSRFCQVVIASNTTEITPVAQSQVIRTEEWKKGFIAMRNYLVPPGTRVITPEIVRISDGVVVRPSTSLVAGPCELDLGQSTASKLLRSISLLALFNALLVGVNFVLVPAISVQTNIFVCLCGGVVGYLLYGACFLAGKKRLKQLMADICTGPNKFFFASLEQGSKTSQPSKLHKYWLMCHDIPAGGEVAVRARINPRYQKYWSLVVYDEYGLPLPQYAYDENAIHLLLPRRRSTGVVEGVKGTKAAAARGKKATSAAVAGEDMEDEEDGVYEIDIRLRNIIHPQGKELEPHAPCNDSCTEIDVSKIPKGYVIFRINHPIGEEVVEFSAPVASIGNNRYKSD
jgi:hypothetical protein